MLSDKNKINNKYKMSPQKFVIMLNEYGSFINNAIKLDSFDDVFKFCK